MHSKLSKKMRAYNYDIGSLRHLTGVYTVIEDTEASTDPSTTTTTVVTATSTTTTTTVQIVNAVANTVQIVRGTLQLTLSTTDADGFTENPAVQRVLQETIAEVIPGVEADMVRIEEVSVEGRRLSTSAADVTVTYVITLAPDNNATAILDAISTMGPQFMSTLNQELLDQGLDYVVQGVEVGTAVIVNVNVSTTTTGSPEDSAEAPPGETKRSPALLIGLVAFGIGFCILVSVCMVCWKRMRNNKNSQ
jgi:hypothetical protein